MAQLNVLDPKHQLLMAADLEVQQIDTIVEGDCTTKEYRRAMLALFYSLQGDQLERAKQLFPNDFERFESHQLCEEIRAL